MRMHRIAVASAVLVCGCACEPTPYQRAGAPSWKGYSERQVSPDTFYVKYVANTCTPDRILSDYLHRRAAELTLQHGFRCFTVLRAPCRSMDLDTRAIPADDEPGGWRTVVVQAPRRGTLLMPIQCFKDAQGPSDTPLIDAGSYLGTKR